jgi:hypothetical protein
LRALCVMGLCDGVMPPYGIFVLMLLGYVYLV